MERAADAVAGDQMRMDIDDTVWLVRYDEISRRATKAGAPADLLCDRWSLRDHVTQIARLTRAIAGIDIPEIVACLHDELLMHAAAADRITDESMERAIEYIASMRSVRSMVGQAVCAEIDGTRFWEPRGNRELSPARIYFGDGHNDWVALDQVYLRGGADTDWTRYRLVESAIRKHGRRVALKLMGL